MNINATLMEARLFVLGNRAKGVHCPACGQWAKIYPRSIHKNMAKGLLDYYMFDRSHPDEYMHVSQCSNHESSQLVWWDLLEEELTMRPDGGRAGFWRITEIGRRFVRGEITVTKKAMVYDHTKLSMEGPQVTFAQCLKRPFDLRELLS